MSRLFSVLALVTVLAAVTMLEAVAEEKPAAKKAQRATATNPFAAGKEAAHAKSPAEKKTPPCVTKHTSMRVGEAAIKQALAQPTEIEFIEAPLTDVIDNLKEHHHIEIQLDNKALGDVGIGSDTPVTRNLKGVSLRSAINLLLRDLNLTWIIQDEVLLITTPEEAESRLATKVYDVSDLVVCRDKDDELWDDYDTLIDVIVSTIKPTTWDCVGGPGSISGASLGTAKVLIVSQVQDVHEEIAPLLAAIREIAKKNPDEEPPQRNKSIIRAQRLTGGTAGAGFHDGTPVSPQKKEFPEKDQSATPKPSK